MNNKERGGEVKEFYFSVDIKGTASGVVKAKNKKEAIEKVFLCDDFDLDWDFDIPYGVDRENVEQVAYELSLEENQ